MARTLIIGVGNPLRCDDGVAWQVISDLSRQGVPQDVEVITQHQLTPELAFPASQSETVLFLDAAVDGQGGELRCQAVTPQRASGVFSHEFSPGTILSLAQELYGKRPQGFVISLGGECFDHGETLSPCVQKNLPRAVSFIKELVTKGAPHTTGATTHG